MRVRIRLGLGLGFGSGLGSGQLRGAVRGPRLSDLKRGPSVRLTPTLGPSPPLFTGPRRQRTKREANVFWPPAAKWLFPKQPRVQSTKVRPLRSHPPAGGGAGAPCLLCSALHHPQSLGPCLCPAHPSPAHSDPVWVLSAHSPTPTTVRRPHSAPSYEGRTHLSPGSLSQWKGQHPASVEQNLHD